MCLSHGSYFEYIRTDAADLVAVERPLNEVTFLLREEWQVSDHNGIWFDF